jgi:hypothetical protein
MADAFGYVTLYKDILGWCGIVLERIGIIAAWVGQPGIVWNVRGYSLECKGFLLEGPGHGGLHRKQIELAREDWMWMGVVGIGCGFGSIWFGQFGFGWELRGVDCLDWV